MALSRRAFLAASLAGIPALSARRPFAGAAAQPAIKPTFSSIRGNVGTMVGRGGTIGWLVTGNGNVLVDTQYPEMAAICLQFLAQQSKKQELKVVVNTHHHGDHTSGNATVREPARQMVGHRNVERLLKTAAREKGVAPVPPDTTFTNDWAIKVGHEEIELRHYGAAHTSGDAIVTFRSANVVHMGDLVFNRRQPYIDRASGGTIDGWIQVLRRAVSDHSPETEYIFGHAGEGFPIRGREADVNHMRDYLIGLRDHVKGAIAKGTSLDQLIKQGGVVPAAADFGPLNEHVLTAAYQEFGPA